MAYASDRVTAPVSISDVQQALGVSSGDVGTLCKAATINMWAKFKPVRKNIINTIPQINENSVSPARAWKPDNDSYFQDPTSPTPWWTADDGNYGLDYTGARVQVSMGTTGGMSDLEYQIIHQLLPKIDGELNGWAYNQPRGGSYNEPYRLTDFNQYWHKAPKPASGIAVSDVTASINSQYSLSVAVREPDSSSQIYSRHYITPRDVAFITVGGSEIRATLYTGFIIFKEDNGSKIPVGWVIDSTDWKGTGIYGAGTTDYGPTRGDTEIIYKLISGVKYYVLPIYATQQLTQPDIANASRLTLSTSETGVPLWLFTVPFTDFEEFSATQAATSQTIGYPDVTNTKATLYATYSSDFTIDSNGTYYQGSTGSFVVQVLVTKTSWDGDLNNIVMLSDGGDVAFNQLYTIASLGSDELLTFGSCSNVGLTINDSWQVVMIVGGERTIHRLITISPNT